MNVGNTFFIKRNDTLPAIIINIKARGCLDQVIPFNLSAVTAVTFSMADESNNLKISSSPAQINSYSGGTLQYNWSSGDTDTEGRYKGEFELLFSGGDKMSVPTKGNINIEILKDINDV